jgi:crossover junction endodeoxyribonuclease RuvC
MLVLGIDPGTAITGYGLLSAEGSRLEVLDFGVINTPARLELAQRLLIIHQQLREIIARSQPEALAVEELFFNRNSKTFFAVSQARGAVVLTAALCGVKVFEYTPLQVKQAVVGYGRAEKEQVQKMVRTLLRMEELVKPDDAADALAIAICHVHSARLSGY